jgi:CheY-like chemotaxis protein
MPLILLIEDDIRLARMVSDFLRENKFDVLHASNGPELFARWPLSHGNGRTSGAVSLERVMHGFWERAKVKALRASPSAGLPAHQSTAPKADIFRTVQMLDDEQSRKCQLTSVSFS